MLTRNQFAVLDTLRRSPHATQEDIVLTSGIDRASVCDAVAGLHEKALIDDEGALTKQASIALEPYRVDSAVILAAGTATRLAPLSFEMPKALFKVRGELLIERLIRQLHQAGVNRIAVVVGYMKEAFFYLEEKFQVSIVVSPEYATRNNHASLFAAKEFLGNSYVCSSDQYYADELFSPYVYAPYCSCTAVEGATDARTVQTDEAGRIRALPYGGTDGWRLQGPAYFDRALSARFIDIIGAEYDRPDTPGKLWDDILADHLDELCVYARRIPAGGLYEFDVLNDLVAFDRDYFVNVDSRILDNICSTLGCARTDISHVRPVKEGLTNLSVRFDARGRTYVYRHPGVGTEELINRQSETFAEKTARELGLDTTFVYENPDEGWKISAFMDGCEPFDYRDEAQVAHALSMARVLHTSGARSPWSFDFYDDAVRLRGMLRRASYPVPVDFDALSDAIADVHRRMQVDVGEPCLCHNDFYGPNLLVRGDEMQLIDWEYAAMGDYACDLGNFVAQGSGYSVPEAVDMLKYYFGRPPTEREARHCVAAVAVVGYYWYVWAIFKEAKGNPMGEWLYTWYKAAKRFCAAANEMYGDDVG
ncbi:MAG: phosphotransferase [Eggerthellaceae bacterium]|jgi:CTP:phosphocholine cytidylyltransferase-like protein/thiamine kinase-like enzyme